MYFDNTHESETTTAPDGENEQPSPNTPNPIDDPPSPDAPVPDAYAAFVSILCGRSNTLTDENNITWIGDEDLISNGFPHMVKSDDLSFYNTLRAFNNTRKKNCYSINAKKGGKFLVRVLFNYGNYDGKESPPTFDLHFDGNFWITVDTSELKFYEAIYVVKREVISVCVAQIYPNQVPFISSLEVRNIDSKAYNKIGLDYALLTNYRIGYGLDGFTSYPSDRYDRWWLQGGDSPGLTPFKNDASQIGFTTADHPPLPALETGVVAQDNDAVISLTLGDLMYPIDYPLYINWYFVVVEELTETKTRSFRMYKDDESISSAITPGLNVTELVAPNISVTINTTFSIVATDDSTLPPLINAIEIFSISNALTDGTNDNDVEGLDSLKNVFDVLKDWNGDPCLPAPYSWDWIECNNDTGPRVISLNLNGYSLSGPLPDFRNMDALEIIDLQNNSLTGSVPDFLGKMPNLKQLHLGDNQFTGSIPSLTSDTGKQLSSKLSVILAITILVFFIF